MLIMKPSSSFLNPETVSPGYASLTTASLLRSFRPKPGLKMNLCLPERLPSLSPDWITQSCTRGRRLRWTASVARGASTTASTAAAGRRLVALDLLEDGRLWLARRRGRVWLCLGARRHRVLLDRAVGSF